jgi:hypothetical protein
MRMMVIHTLDGPYVLTHEEEQWVRLFPGRFLGPENEPCGRPLPALDGTGVCLRCGWQHARRAPGGVERVAVSQRAAM